MCNPRPVGTSRFPEPIARSLLRAVQAIGYGSIVGGLLVSSGPAASQTPTPAPSPAAPTAPALGVARPVLRVGSQGDQVVELQALLTLLGYYSGAIDGLYQEGTAQAVIAFQRSAGLQADGVVGANTWRILLPPIPVEPQPTAPAPTAPAPATPAPTAPAPAPIATAPIELPTLRLGMRGPAVARLQERLRAAGFFDGAIDGVFGPQTQAAVRAAQQRYRLTPDGVVGPATWGALLR